MSAVAAAQRFRDPADPLNLLIVRDMWLTSINAPRVRTTYKK